MNAIWKRIAFWLKHNAPDVLDTLKSGATDVEIEQIEAAMCLSFPNDMKESYKIYNGQEADYVDGSVFGLFDGYELLSLESLVQVWAGWKRLLDQGVFDRIGSEPIGPVRPLWWSNLWIPITDNGHGDSYCVDLYPALDGSVGQIISVYHDHPSRSLLAISFHNWLECFANELEGGLYIFSEEYGGVMKKDDV